MTVPAEPEHWRAAPSPLAWGASLRLAAAAVAGAGLWLAVAWALDWWR